MADGGGWSVSGVVVGGGGVAGWWGWWVQVVADGQCQGCFFPQAFSTTHTHGSNGVTCVICDGTGDGINNCIWL